MAEADLSGDLQTNGELTAAAPVSINTHSREPLPGPGFWGALGWTLLLFFAVQTYGSLLVLGLLIAGLQPDDTIWAMFVGSTATIALLSVGLSIGLLAPAVLRRLAVTRPRAWHVLFTLLLVAPLACLVQEIAAWAGEILPTFSQEYYELFAAAPWPLVLLCGCLLPAFGEEIFFRGLIGRGVVARLGVIAGTLWGSFLFAIMHLDPTQAAGILFVGIALQLVMLASRSILVPMLLHFSNNLLSFAMMKADLFSQLDHLPPPLVAAGALALLPVAALFWRSRSQWMLPDGQRWDPGFVTADAPPAELGAQLVGGRPSIFLLLLAVALQAGFWMVLVALA